MPKHKRGGSYNLRIMSDVTNWNGTLLDRQILNYLKIGDTVRVIFEPHGEPRYVEITDVLPNGYYKGFIDDPYSNRYCNICRIGGVEKGEAMYHCDNWMCEFDCHLSCLHLFTFQTPIFTALKK